MIKSSHAVIKCLTLLTALLQKGQGSGPACIISFIRYSWVIQVWPDWSLLIIGSPLWSYGGTDPLGMFPLFLKKTAEVLAPHLAVVFRRLLRLGSFTVCWRVANVTPIPKGPPSSSASNYRPISLIPILSKVFERLVSVRLGRFMEGRGVLPTTQFAYRKGLGTCDALLCVTHSLQSALEMG